MNELDKEAARAFCAGFTDADSMARLDRFVDMLAEENGRQNLVSSQSIATVWERHLADSLQLLAHVPRETGLWLDLGTGAGFPGLVIAIARPDMEIRLVESRRRRVEWLERVAGEMGLEQCKVLGARLEHVESFPAQVITARAFAPLTKLIELSTRFSTRDTLWLLPKGRSAAQELSEQPVRIQQMFHVEQSRTDSQAGILIGRGAPEIR